MIIFSLLFQVVIGIVAVSCQQYVQQQYLGPYAGAIDQISQQQSSSGASSSASASSSGQSNNIGNYISGPVGYGAGPVAYGAGPINAVPVGGAIGAVPLPGPVPSLGCGAVDPKVRTTFATQSFHQNKGEILIHRPAPIIVKRPPTRVLVNHPPLVVKPAPVVLHKPPPVVMRKVFVKQHPRPVKVEPVYVNVVKPPAEKYYVNDKTAPVVAPMGYRVPMMHQHTGSLASAQSAAQSAAQSGGCAGGQQYRI